MYSPIGMDSGGHLSPSCDKTFSCVADRSRSAASRFKVRREKPAEARKFARSWGCSIRSRKVVLYSKNVRNGLANKVNPFGQSNS